MDISIKLPTRILIIGATHTGKTKLITDMILRTDFGRLKQLEIYYYNPIQLALHQPLLKMLEDKGVRVIYNILSSTTRSPPPPAKFIKRLIIFDDLDDVRGIPRWVCERFTAASHHLSESVICISHKLKIGAVCIRTSAEWIILTYATDVDLAQTCKDLGVDYKTVKKILTDPKGLVEVSPLNFKSYNHVVINMGPNVDRDGKNLPKFYKLNSFSKEKTFTPIKNI